MRRKPNKTANGRVQRRDMNKMASSRRKTIQITVPNDRQSGDIQHQYHTRQKGSKSTACNTTHSYSNSTLQSGSFKMQWEDTYKVYQAVGISISIPLSVGSQAFLLYKHVVVGGPLSINVQAYTVKGEAEDTGLALRWLRGDGELGWGRNARSRHSTALRYSLKPWCYLCTFLQTVKCDGALQIIVNHKANGSAPHSHSMQGRVHRHRDYLKAVKCRVSRKCRLTPAHHKRAAAAQGFPELWYSRRIGNLAPQHCLTCVPGP